MSCNCNGCGQPPKLCRCPKKNGTPRAYIKECSDCDPCKPCESMVKICSFVVPTLTEGQVFRNSFVYNQEDDAVYYITDDGTPIRFGASPMFIDYFDPSSQTPTRQIVFDFENKKAYVYNPEGNYIEVPLDGGTAKSAKRLSVSIAPGDNIQDMPLDDSTETEFHFLATDSDAVFTDSEGTTYTPEQVFELVDGGEEIILDNVPFSTIVEDTGYDYPNEVGGVLVMNKQSRSTEGSSVVIYSGDSALVMPNLGKEMFLSGVMKVSVEGVADSYALVMEMRSRAI